MRGKINDATAEIIRQTQFTLIMFSWMIKQNGPFFLIPVLVLAKKSWQTKFHVKFRLAYKTQAQECNFGEKLILS